MSTIRRFLPYMLLACALGIWLSAPAMTGSTAVEESTVGAAPDQQPQSPVARDKVRALLESQGVDVIIAKERVDALTDDELEMLAGQIDQVPTGNSDILGILLSVIVVLIVTDVLGLTRILPFTRSIR